MDEAAGMDTNPLADTPLAPDAAPPLDAVRAAAAVVAARCLQRGRSLLAPRRALWTPGRLGDLAARLERAAARASTPGARPAPFQERWRRTLARADDATVALAAEVLYLHLLFPATVSGERKRTLLAATRARLPGAAPLPPALDVPLDGGIAPAGRAYTRRRLTQLAWLAAAAAALRRLPAATRRGVLDDPAQTSAALRDVLVRGGGPQRAALLHLLHPATFVPVTSVETRDRILRAFAEHVPPGVDDPDCALAAVHAALADELGADFSFFAPQVAARWRGPIAG
jgi:5-methylcytosine-specific restriction enzyme B